MATLLIALLFALVIALFALQNRDGTRALFVVGV